MRFLRTPRFLAVALVGLIASLGVLQAAPRAALADDWCWMDPIFIVNGPQIQVNIGVQGNGATVAAAGVVANITVLLLGGVSTNVVVPPGTTPCVETLNFVRVGTYDGNGPIPVVVVTTFTSRTRLGAEMQATWPSGRTNLTFGTTRGVLPSASLLLVP